MADTDFLGMSDEEFLKSELETTPPVEKVETEGKIPPTETVDEPVVQPKVETGVANPHAETSTKKGKAAPKSETVVEQPEKVVAKKPEKTSKEPSEEEVTDTSEDDSDQGETATETTGGDSPDYEAFYMQVMKPFKANGRTVELKSPQEAISLMQMGANYTKKMQELVPHRKMITMLQNNGLLDEGKLSYLIDLDKKNPEAIKKLVKDAGLDPMEIDTSVESNYRQGNHTVTDEEVAFHTALEDMKSTPERLGTVKVINESWDQASKEALWKSPDIMTTIHQQRENGVYDQVVAEMDRRKMLGDIPAGVPFLQAYKVVGDQMTASNSFKGLVTKSAPTAKAKAVVATRVETSKSAVTNSERAAAASGNRQSPASGKKAPVNPLAMADDDFLKMFAGRV